MGKVMNNLRVASYFLNSLLIVYRNKNDTKDKYA